jgi:hypothetical protein
VQISDSEDSDDGFTPDQTVTEDDRQVSSRHKNVKMTEVAVPPPSFKMPSKRTSRTVADSPSSVTPSVNGSVIDLSSDYDTPDTSVAVTPAETASRTVSSSTAAAESSYTDSGRKGKGVSATVRAQQLRESIFAPRGSSSRKRNLEIIDDNDDDDSPDARLARRLQAEEYNDIEPKRVKTSYSATDQETDDSFVIDDDSDSDIGGPSFVEYRSKFHKTSKASPSSKVNKKNGATSKFRRPITIPDSDDDYTLFEPPDLDTSLDMELAGALGAYSSESSDDSVMPSARALPDVGRPGYLDVHRRRVCESTLSPNVEG